MDIKILEWINATLHGSNVINQMFRFITYLGEEGIGWLITAIVLLFFRKTRRVGLLMLAGYGAVAVMNSFILKNIINRPRPFADNEGLRNFITGIGMELPTSSSCPSGHTAISVTSSVILVMNFKKKGMWAIIPAFLISFSRVFLCVHYPTDVLAGVLEGLILGVSVTIVGRIILYKLESWWNKRKGVTSTANESNVEEEELSNVITDESDIQKEDENVVEEKEKASGNTESVISNNVAEIN